MEWLNPFCKAWCFIVDGLFCKSKAEPQEKRAPRVICRSEKQAAARRRRQLSRGQIKNHKEVETKGANFQSNRGQTNG